MTIVPTRPRAPGAGPLRETARPVAPPSRPTTELVAKYGAEGLNQAADAYTSGRSNALKELHGDVQMDLAAAVADLAAFEEMSQALKRFGGQAPDAAADPTAVELKARHALLLSAEQVLAVFSKSVDDGARPDERVLAALEEVQTKAEQQIAQATSPEVHKDADRFRAAQVVQWRDTLRSGAAVDHGGELTQALSELAWFHEAHRDGVPKASRAEELRLGSRVLALTERSAAEQTKQVLRQKLEAHVAELAAMPEDQRGTSFSTWRDLAIPLRAVAMLEDVAGKHEAVAAGARVAAPVPTLTGLAAQLTTHMASAYLKPSVPGAALPESTRLCLTAMLAYATRDEAPGAPNAASAAPGQKAASASGASDTAGRQTFVPFQDLGDAFASLGAALPPELRARIAKGYGDAKTRAPGLAAVEGIVRALFTGR